MPRRGGQGGGGARGGRGGLGGRAGRGGGANVDPLRILLIAGWVLVPLSWAVTMVGVLPLPFGAALAMAGAAAIAAIAVIGAPAWTSRWRSQDQLFLAVLLLFCALVVLVPLLPLAWLYAFA